MFGSTHGGANAYAKVGLETGVTAADPHQLIVMLFEGALSAVASARQYMQDGNISHKGMSISKAIAIIDNGLRASLDKNVGGEIALSLDSLYAYMSSRLLIANLKNQPEVLDEVHKLLSELKGAWDAIGGKNAVAAEQPAAAPVTSNDPLAPRQSNLMKA